VFNFLRYFINYSLNWFINHFVTVKLVGMQFLTFSTAKVFLPQLIKIYCNHSVNIESISQPELTCLSEHFRAINLIVF